MERRGFLGAMLAACAAPAIVRAASLMKVSGIVIPTDEEVFAVTRSLITIGGNANSLLTPQIIARESLRILEANLTMASKVNRHFDKQFVQVGNLVIRKPARSLDG